MTGSHSRSDAESEHQQGLTAREPSPGGAPPVSPGPHSLPEQAAPAAPEGGAPPADRTWVGYVAYATGALGMNLVAIVAGFVGMRAVKRGQARDIHFPLAGMILGFVGLVGVIAGVWWGLEGHTTAATADARAQQDVSAVGAAVALAVIHDGHVPEVAVTDSGYVVAGEGIEAQLPADRTLTLQGDGPATWCLEITYEGGAHPAFSYAATSGLSAGGC